MSCYELKLTSEAVNPFRRFGKTPWTRDRHIIRSLPTRDSMSQRNANIIHASSGIRTHDPSVCAVQDHMRLGQRGHRDQDSVSAFDVIKISTGVNRCTRIENPSLPDAFFVSLSYPCSAEL